MPLLKRNKEDMNKKELEYLERLVSADTRFLENKKWLEEMNVKFNTGHPAYVWANALVMADKMQNSEVGRDIVMSEWGKGMKNSELYAVRKMAIYILEHPTEYRSLTSSEELYRMKDMVRLQEHNLRGKQCSPYYVELFDSSCEGSMVAEHFLLEIIKKKTIGMVIKEFVRYSDYLSFTFLTFLLAFISACNNELGGPFNEDVGTVLGILNERQKRVEMQKAEQGHNDCIFSKEQIDGSGIIQFKRVWLEIMYKMLNDNDKEKYSSKKHKVDDTDFCVGFYVVLRENGEFRYKGGFIDFFKMMSDLYNIDIDDNGKSNIIRYIEDNKKDYRQWEDNSGIRYSRKKIAIDLSMFFDNFKKKKGLK